MAKQNKPSLGTTIRQNSSGVLAALMCIVIGLVIGLIALFIINPEHALVDGFWRILQGGFYDFPYGCGKVLTQTAPLIMTGLSVAFAFKTGLFNIGAAGQYTLGAFGALYFAIVLGMPWWVCLLLAMAAGAVLGTVSGILKSYCNVNEVISGIMLNWITLYAMNDLLTNVKETASPYTMHIGSVSPESLMPTLGLDALFSNNQYVTISIPIAMLVAVIVYIVMEKTKFGYELKATGFNKNAAKYCGMAEKRNTILTLLIGGGLAGLGAGLFYLTGFEQWSCGQSSVPAMGFNGIAAAFLGGLNPVGAIFSSYFIQHITVGGAYLDKSMYCTQISDLISSIIIYLCGFVLFMKYVMNNIAAKREEKAKAAAQAAGQEGGDE